MQVQGNYRGGDEVGPGHHAVPSQGVHQQQGTHMPSTCVVHFGNADLGTTFCAGPDLNYEEIRILPWKKRTRAGLSLATAF